MNKNIFNLQMRICILFLVFSSITLLGQNQFSSIVHVYVPASWSYDIHILFNEQEICDLEGHKMLTYEIYSTGYMRITAKTQASFGQLFTANANVNIHEGETYYFALSLPAWRWSKLEIIQKDKELGEKEILKIKDKNVIVKKEDRSAPITEPPVK